MNWRELRAGVLMVVMLLGALPFRAEAQDASQLSRLKGLTAEEVLQHYGDPEEKRSTGPVAEVWTYGRSMIIFSNERVSAWSDAGELTGRLRLADVREGVSERTTENWVNPWTPTERVDSNRILSDLLPIE